MKTVKKNVYYCEHCNNKRGLSASAMSVHEKHCTANPDRECRMCNNYEGGSTNNIREIVEELKSRFVLELNEKEQYEGGPLMKDYKAKWTGKPITIEEIRNRVDGCPNCMLAIIRQSKFAYHYFEGTEFGEFDYKKEFSERSAEIRQMQYDNQHYYGY